MNILPHISVIICTYNRCDSLLNTLASLYQDGYKGSAVIDIVVVANNCSDNTLERLRTFKKEQLQGKLNLVVLEEPSSGKSYALNTAIKSLDSDVFCFIDDDQIVEQDFIKQLIDGVALYPDIDIFCGRIWPDWDGSEPSWVHESGDFAIPIRPFPEYDLGGESVELLSQDRLPSGGNISVRKNVFDSIGLFSVELGPTRHNLVGGEDHDFLLRATSKGFKIRYLPKLRQLHAIDSQRTSTRYTMYKSYIRSRSSFVIHAPTDRLHLYMFNKVFRYLGKLFFSFDKNRRMFYMVRLSASIGELAGALVLYSRRIRGDIV